MNHYGILSCKHNSWPILLMIYNMSHWLCMMRKYITLCMMILRPKQPENNIDMYFKLLINDLKMLWKTEANTFNALPVNYTNSLIV